MYTLDEGMTKSISTAKIRYLLFSSLCEKDLGQYYHKALIMIKMSLSTSSQLKLEMRLNIESVEEMRDKVRI